MPIVAFRIRQAGHSHGYLVPGLPAWPTIRCWRAGRRQPIHYWSSAAPAAFVLVLGALLMEALSVGSIRAGILLLCCPPCP